VEAARGLDHHLRRSQHAQFVADGVEVAFDLGGLGLPRRRELVEDCRFQRVAGAHVTEGRGDEDRHRTEQDQGSEELGREAPADDGHRCSVNDMGREKYPDRD